MLDQVSFQKFAARYPVAIENYEQAKIMYQQGQIKFCLVSVRGFLESLLIEFCKKSGEDSTDDDKTTSMDNRINQLKEWGMIDETEASTLHRVRMLGNKGTHVALNPTADDAQEAIELLEKALDIFASKDDDISFENQRKLNNVAVPKPNYYDTERRYRGKWCFSYTWEELASNGEYTKLEQDASNGDISAMLDIAIGFLPKKEPVWGDEQLVYMPKCRGYYREKTYDARYYFWIISACNQAVRDAKIGKEIPKKYMSTALFEALKFIYIYQFDGPAYYYISDVHGQSMTYSDQFLLVRELYKKDVFETTPVFEWASLLLALIEEAQTTDVIDPLHRYNRSVDAIKYLVYCFCYLKKNTLPGSKFLIDGDEYTRCEQIITLDDLSQCEPNGFDDHCEVYYDIANRYTEWRVKEAKENAVTAAAEESRAMKQARAEKRKKSLILRIFRGIVWFTVLVVIMQFLASGTEWGQSAMKKMRQIAFVDSTLRFVDYHIFSVTHKVIGDKAYSLFPHGPDTEEIERLLKNCGATGAQYSEYGTYALFCKDGGKYTNENIEWNDKLISAIVWRNGSILGNSYMSYIVLSDEWDELLKNDPEHIARLDVSSQFQSWIGLRGNSTITEVKATLVPKAAAENQVGYAHYNIHLRLQDNRTNETFWVRCYLPDKEITEVTSMLPVGILTVCSLKALSEEEAASLLLGRNIKNAERAYQRELALRVDGSARGAEIAERVSSQYDLHFTTGADSVVCSESSWWETKIYSQDDEWIHVLAWLGCVESDPEYYIWAEDEGTWLEDEKFVGGTPCDEYVQKLVGLENGLRVTSAQARYFEEDATDRLLDISWAQYVIDLHMEDIRTGRRYVALLCIPLRNGAADIDRTINELATHEFGGFYDISDLTTIEAAEYLNRLVG